MVTFYFSADSMGYGISYANAPGVGEQTYIGRPPFGGCH